MRVSQTSANVILFKLRMIKQDIAFGLALGEQPHDSFYRDAHTPNDRLTSEYLRICCYASEKRFVGHRLDHNLKAVSFRGRAGRTFHRRGKQVRANQARRNLPPPEVDPREFPTHFTHSRAVSRAFVRFRTTTARTHWNYSTSRNPATFAQQLRCASCGHLTTAAAWHPVIWIRLAGLLVAFVGLAFAWRQSLSKGPRAQLPETTLHIDTQVAKAHVDARYLSVAIDIASVVGGPLWETPTPGLPMGANKKTPYDFSRPQLQRLAAALAPAYLRIGGTDADRTLYDLDAEPAPAPNGAWRLHRAQWDALNAFALKLDYRIMFTLNAGALARDEHGRWNPDNARALMVDARQRQYPVDVWELGNEVNAYPLLHRHWLSAKSYVDDLQVARWLIDEVNPQARLAGPAVAFWPGIGEGLPLIENVMKAGGPLLDVITWHYYPQQSFRCPVATNRAHAGHVLRPRELKEVERWADFVQRLASRDGPQAQVWLGETGGAQCGGEPGQSDRFASSLWWLDQLGRMAKRGQRVVVRQTLTGGDYGLIDDETLLPNPDYWASLLWRRLMGTTVLDVWGATHTAGVQPYAHCQRNTLGGVSFVLINVHPSQDSTLRLPPLGPGYLYLVEADGPRAKDVRLNGSGISLDAQGELPQLLPHAENPDSTGAVEVTLPPLSYAFVTFPEAGAAACQPGPESPPR